MNQEDGQCRDLKNQINVFQNRIIIYHHTGTRGSKVSFEGPEANVISAIKMVYH